jgi:hypothetical protein
MNRKTAVLMTRSPTDFGYERYIQKKKPAPFGAGHAI